MSTLDLLVWEIMISAQIDMQISFKVPNSYTLFNLSDFS